jgi:IS30 family transposase
MGRLTLSDRTQIEIGIYRHETFAEIAKRIHVSPRYVSEEIRNNFTFAPGKHWHGKTCTLVGGCKRIGLCGKENCHKRCLACKEIDCQTICRVFNDKPCSKLLKPPYVCNACNIKRNCKKDRKYYDARHADAVAKRRFSEARSKPHIRDEELEELDDLVTPLIKKGQPITHIYAEHGDELPVCQRTLYNYIDSGNLSLTNLDLRRKVGYRPRKKKPMQVAAHKDCPREGRTYEDFLRYMKKHPGTAYVEMDTVKGCRERGKRMLTMFFVNQNLMLIFLMRDGTAGSVVEQFDCLTACLGLDTFRALFPVILTDNGSEFKHVEEMEKTEDGERRTRVFYCDPQASWQKGHIEKNHEFIRYVLPRGKSFNPYTQDDITLLVNHINSTRRLKLDGKTPYEAAQGDAFQCLKDMLGLYEIPADEVNLKPALLKRH